MEIHQVRYFLAVTETRSFTRAAERAGVSQPALTAAIKKLEEDLGGALFLRERGGAKLTALGQHVLPRFQRLRDETQAVRTHEESQCGDFHPRGQSSSMGGATCDERTSHVGKHEESHEEGHAVHGVNPAASVGPGRDRCRPYRRPRR